MSKTPDTMPMTPYKIEASKAETGPTHGAAPFDFARGKPGGLPADRRFRAVAMSSMAPNEPNFPVSGLKMRVGHKNKANQSQLGPGVIRWKGQPVPGRSGRLRCHQWRQTNPIPGVSGLKTGVALKTKPIGPGRRQWEAVRPTDTGWGGVGGGFLLYSSAAVGYTLGFRVHQMRFVVREL